MCESPSNNSNNCQMMNIPTKAGQEASDDRFYISFKSNLKVSNVKYEADGCVNSSLAQAQQMDLNFLAPAFHNH